MGRARSVGHSRPVPRLARACVRGGRRATPAGRSHPVLQLIVREPEPADRAAGTLDRGSLAAPALDAARALLGAYLVRDADPATGAERRRGRIVEVEAYIGETDRASHARFGRTGRNAVMYGPAGVAYVYLVYGMYDCLNVVVEPLGSPAAVLVRAVEPLDGIDAMRASRARRTVERRRTRDAATQAATEERIARLPAARLASGPGLVAAAFDLTRADTGRDLCDPTSPLRLERAVEDAVSDAPRFDVVATPRIGIDYAGEPWTSAPWRFILAGHPSLSGRR